jgi:hypothetical protein
LICSNNFSIFNGVNGIANQIQFHQSTIAVFTQTTFQFRFISGPPLFQGFIAASVCNNQGNTSQFQTVICLCSQLIIHKVIVFGNSASVFQIAIANCHTVVSFAEENSSFLYNALFSSSNQLKSTFTNAKS